MLLHNFNYSMETTVGETVSSHLFSPLKEPDSELELIALSLWRLARMSGDGEGTCFRSLSSRSHTGASVSLGQPGSHLESALQAAES